MIQAGLTLNKDAAAPEFAKSILALCDNPSRYAHMSAKARQFYEQSLNWQSWQVSALKIFDQEKRR